MNEQMFFVLFFAQKNEEKKQQPHAISKCHIKILL
jgi:hypothetical protein